MSGACSCNQRRAYVYISAFILLPTRMNERMKRFLTHNRYECVIKDLVKIACFRD